MAESKISKDRLRKLLQENMDKVEKLSISWKFQDTLENKTNGEMANILREYVWAEIPLFSALSDIIASIMDRLHFSPDYVPEKIETIVHCQVYDCNDLVQWEGWHAIKDKFMSSFDQIVLKRTCDEHKNLLEKDIYEVKGE